MKFLNFIILGLFIVFSVAAGGNAEDVSATSGTIEGGLRIIDIDSSNKDLEFTIYRGDYIVFNFADGGSYDFKVPGLKIDETMPKLEGETPYVKMKESGDFQFTLGGRAGVFHVLELVDARYQEVTAAEAVTLIKNVNPVIIDVRTSGEYNSGHIPGANLLPVQVFEDNLGKLEQFKDKDVLLYCASGNRSTVAARILIDAGFTKVYNLRRGMGEWASQNLPVE